MVFGLFSKEKSLQRTIERATNKLAQQADRWGALEKLRDDGSDEALFGMCKRFGITSNNHVEDQQEKAWVVDALVGKGPAALAPLRRYLKGAPHLSYALTVLERIGTREQILETVDTLFADETPGYTRDPERRLDLIRWMSEWKDAGADAVPRLLPYVKDFDQNVRVAAAEAIADQDIAATGPTLLDAFVRPEEESGRFRRRVAEILAANKYPLGDKAAAVAPLLVGPVGSFAIDGGVLVAR
ncbi:MAG TPA: HEAT repeat domain-containing protein [Kofleriaceae bacterium]|jgi:HEAT repeat protein|nr:HEAT repeat domain-containing protein [Kofleriaceae bacterium]